MSSSVIKVRTRQSSAHFRSTLKNSKWTFYDSYARQGYQNLLCSSVPFEEQRSEEEQKREKSKGGGKEKATVTAATIVRPNRMT
jgi:hypothetical protein